MGLSPQIVVVTYFAGKLQLSPSAKQSDPAQSTDSVFYASAMTSGLVDGQQMDYAIRVCRHRLSQQGRTAEGQLPERLLADILVEQEVLTEYQADQLIAGRTKFFLGPYLITDWIGQGGMGQVFKGIHQLMGRECAVKVLPLARATQDARDSFAQEIRMQARLDCPYLVRAFDAGQDGSVHYLVTEYVPGMDLRRLVKSQGALPIRQASRIIMQAALGLQYAHEQGLVHRDVKPGNILVTPEGDAKVSDVGLAGFAKQLIDDPRAGKIVGTADYLSPEQIRTPLEIAPASDIYSLGCTLYYAVCGKVPFPGGDTHSKLRRHLEGFALHPRNFAPEITEDFVDIIVDMMEKDVEKRISNAGEVAARLEPWAIDADAVTAVRMPKSPWMAPPPPSYGDPDLRDWRDEQIDGGSLGAMDSTGAVLPSQSDTVPPPVQPEASDVSFEGTGNEPSSQLSPSHPPTADRQNDRQQYPGDHYPGDQYAGDQYPGDQYLGDQYLDDDYPAQQHPVQRSPAAQLAPGIQSLEDGRIRPGDGSMRTESSHRQSERDGPSVGMIVALTAAIIVPPALLAGAILGYLVAQR